METVTTLEKETIDALQDLARANLDSHEGFNLAANLLDREDIAREFRAWATERDTNARRLQELVALNGEDPISDSSTKSQLHRWWMELRDKIKGSDDYAILAEAERGEDFIKEKYEDLLVKTAGSAVNDVLQQQYARVKQVHDKVRDLRDAHRDNS